MTRKLVIFGATSQARLAHYFFTHDSDHDVVAFSVDADFIDEPEFVGLPVVPFEDIERTHPPADHDLFVALGYTKMNRVRADKYHEAKAKGYTLPTYISSRATYLSQFPPGDNCLILEDNTVQPFVRIGNDVTLWSGNHIGHDVEIGDHVFITSQVVVSGFTRIEPYCFLGVNATLRDAITIGEATLVGAGAVIMKDTKPGSVHVPERARELTITSDEIQIS